MRTVLYVTLALALAGCGSGSGSGGGGGAGGGGGGGSGGGGGGTSSCSITLAGALTGTYSCAAPQFFYTAPNNQSQFSVAHSTGSTDPGITVSLMKAGSVSSGATWASSDSGAMGSFVVQPQTINQQWDAFAGHGSSDQGSYSASFTSVSGASDGSGLTTYTAHGTVTATLPPNSQSSGSGNVMLTVTF